MSDAFETPSLTDDLVFTCQKNKIVIFFQTECLDRPVESFHHLIMRWFKTKYWVAGVRYAGRGRKTWSECAKDDMDELGLHSE